MNLIYAQMARFGDLLCGKGVDKNRVEKAEQSLSLSFADDYKEYLESMGTAAVNGHELTGLGGSEEVNVVSSTLREKSERDNSEIPKNFYLIENLYIDGVCAWQNEKGEVFLSQGGNYKKICNSLIDYIGT